jgi:hypothetical protein
VAKANLPALRPPLKLEDYAGPLRGDLRWSGSLEPAATLTIQAGKPGAGELAGDLPRVPATVDVLSGGVAVVEPPSAANQYDRVVVKNASAAPVSNIQIRWRIVR